GRRPGPAEDCGGPAGYELIAAAADPDHPDHEDAVTEFARTFGDGIDPAEMSTTPFDQDAINGALACFGSVAGGLVSGSSAAGGGSAAGDGDGADLAGLPRPLTELADAVRTPSAKGQLLRLLGHANLAQPAGVDAATAARMVHPYTWLLNRVGDDGIKLTDAGHLPPSHVKAALAELDLPGGPGRAAGPGGWGQRENQTAPMLHLRESAQALGLLRKHRGRLVRTARGAALRDDPAALWRYLAERMPFGTVRSPEVQAGLVLLICVAAGCTGTLDRTIARTLTAIGWINGDGSPLTPGEAAEVTGRTRMTLRRLGVLPAAPGTDATSDMRAGAPPRPGPDGMAFARAALLTWAYPV
ncbi:MAG TPA: hypothetical protein VKV33_10725, partial [Streptosporangiaceae bacterium]|nr:hypothetical protein [Streptosporangiaceae bacterium]